MPLKSITTSLLLLSLVCLVLTVTASCSNPQTGVMTKTDSAAVVQKPPSSFTDTIEIAGAAAVFFQPDSMQMKKIKAVTEARIFDGSMHEYIYQTRNAHIYLKKHWPALKSIEAQKVRYLLFRKMDNTLVWKDLDKQDAYGMFLFDGKNDPHLVDMMNIESEVPAYFNRQ